MQRAVLSGLECGGAESIRDRFSATFHSSFSVYAAGDAGWTLASEGELTSRAAREFLTASCCERPARTVVKNTRANTVLVATPLTIDGRPFLILGEVEGIRCEIALSVAEQITDTVGFQFETASQLKDCSVQISRDFEELKSLRELVKCLHLKGAVHRSFARSAEAVLPLLLPSLECDEVAVVTTCNGAGDPTSEPPRPEVIRYGGSDLSDEAVLTVATHFGHEASTIPIVNNAYQQDGLSGFIITGVSQQDRVYGWLIASNSTASAQSVSGRKEEFGTYEANILSSAASILATHASNIELLDQNEQLLVSVTRSLVATLEAKDLYTRGHSERVALYAKRIATELGFDSKECERIYLTGLLHDIGKIAVPDATLNKKGRLTEEEMNQIRCHPEAGWNILRDLEPLRYVLPGVLYHHERIDGKGYPHELSGDDIPLAGRILAVADAYDAMTSDRSYRESLSQLKAENVLMSGSGSQWDTDVVSAAFDAMTDLVRIRGTYYAKQVGIVASPESPSATI